MKATSITLVAAAMFITLTSEKCDKAQAQEGAGGTGATSGKTVELVGPRWNLNTLAGEAIRLPEGVENPFLSLAADNTVHGYTGCNKLNGTLKVDGSSVSFPGLGTTKMFCEKTKDLESAFLTALNATNTYKLKGEQLILLDKGKELATFVRAE